MVGHKEFETLKIKTSDPNAWRWMYTQKDGIFTKHLECKIKNDLITMFTRLEKANDTEKITNLKDHLSKLITMPSFENSIDYTDIKNAISELTSPKKTEAELKEILDSQIKAILNFARKKQKGKRESGEKHVLLCPTNIVNAMLKVKDKEMKIIVISDPDFFSKNNFDNENMILYRDKDGIQVRNIPEDKLNRGVYVLDTINSKNPYLLASVAKEWLYWGSYQHKITMIIDDEISNHSEGFCSQEQKFSGIVIDVSNQIKNGHYDLEEVFNRFQ